MSEWVSGRTHSNGEAVKVCRVVKDGQERFYADFGPHQPSAVGHHVTEPAAQADADQIMTATGHTCSDSCGPWTQKSN